MVSSTIELQIPDAGLQQASIPSLAERPSWGRYMLNAAVVTGLTAISAVVNRVIGNPIVLGSKANTEGASLLANYVSSGLINHTVKGNIRHVDSQWKQIGAIAGYTLGSIAVDAAVGAMFGGPILSATTAITIANAAAHLIKIGCYKIVGKKPYVYGEETPASPETLKTRQKLNLLMGFGVSLAAAAAGQFLPQSASMTAILYNLYSAAYRKMGKASLQITENKKGRQAVVAGQLGLAFAASALAGSFRPFESTAATGTLESLWDVAKQYFGPTSAIALTGYATDQFWRAKGKWKPPGPHAEPIYKKKKSCIHSAVFLGETAAAATANGLNAAYFGGSPTVSLGSKLWQQGLTYHTLREALKGTSGLRKAGFLGLAAASSVIPQLGANFIVNDGTGAWPVTALAVSLGNVAAFTAKAVRNTILPKPTHH